MQRLVRFLLEDCSAWAESMGAPQCELRMDAFTKRRNTTRDNTQSRTS